VASEVVSFVIADVEEINIERVVASTFDVVFCDACVTETSLEVVAIVVVHGFVSSFV